MITQLRPRFAAVAALAVLFVLSSVLAATARGASATPLQPLGDPGDWKLAFDSEFNGTSLNPDKWTALPWENSDVVGNPADVSVAGGDLRLTLSAAGSGSTPGSGGFVGTTSFNLPVGGFMEASIDFPGPGTTPGTSIYNWPDFWASGSDWPLNGESDVAEGLGQISSNYHFGTIAGQQSAPMNSGPIPGNWSNSFHTYGLYRGPNECVVYYDGQIVNTYNTDDAGGPQQLLLTVNSTTGPAPPTGSSAPAATGAASTIEVADVRAWVPAGS